MVRIGVAGAAGRMGREVVREVLAHPDLVMAGGMDRPEHPPADLGTLAGLEPTGVTLATQVSALLDTCDVLIEFSQPEATVAHAEEATGAGRAYVVGTTGLNPAQEARLRAAAGRAPVVWAANMSLGVNLLQRVVEQVARALPASFDIEIVELHHRGKVDAPSGTALALGRAAARGRGVDLEEVAVRGRDGITGPRLPGGIGFAALRGGDVVGEHKVIFAASGERIQLSHIATDRAIYARGAVQAARWVAGRPPGLYNMADVLGIA